MPPATKTPRTGRPPTAPSSLTSRRAGTVRQSLDLRPDMLEAIARLAEQNPAGPVSRADMVRALLGEALAARGVAWQGAAAAAPASVQKKKKGGRK